MTGIWILLKSPLGKGLALLVAVGIAILAFNLWLDDKREQAVVKDRKAANAELSDAAVEALTNATDAQTKRAEDFANAQATDRKRIEDATHNDSSPLDALFPSR